MKFTKIALKFTFAIILGIIIIFSSSCKKDDECLTDATGTYVGIESCPGVNNNLTMVISPSVTDGKVVISISGTAITFNGDLSSNCSSISIPSQNVTGQTGTVDGSFSLNGTNLSGTLNFSNNSCSYNFSKQ